MFKEELIDVRMNLNRDLQHNSFHCNICVRDLLYNIKFRVNRDRRYTFIGFNNLIFCGHEIRRFIMLNYYRNFINNSGNVNAIDRWNLINYVLVDELKVPIFVDQDRILNNDVLYFVSYHRQPNNVLLFDKILNSEYPIHKVGELKLI